MPKVNYVQPDPASDITITYPNVSGTLATTATVADEKAKVSSNDTTAGYLNGKLVAGTGVTLTENNNGGNETLTIAASGGVTGFESTIITSPSPWAATDANARLLANGPSSNISISLQPKNAGSLTADRADNTTTGGNLRGQYAVDWQFGNRSWGANRVASGNYSVICGGTNNQASATQSIVVGGDNNRATLTRSIIVGGTNNQAQSTDAVIVGGNSNIASGQLSFIGGGQSNQASGQYSVVGGGFGNISSGYASVVTGGLQNTASSNYCVVIGGISNVASMNNTNVLGGQNNTAQHPYATAIGGQYATSYNSGSWNYSNFFQGTAGDAQFSDNIYTGYFTGAGTNALRIMGGLAEGVAVPTFSVVTFQIQVSAREMNTVNCGSWIITGMAQRNSGATLSLNNVSVNLIHRTVGGWDVSLIADNVNNVIGLRGTQTAGQPIAWVAAGRFTYCRTTS